MKAICALILRATVIAASALILTACGGGSSSTSGTNVNPTGGGGGTSAISVSGAGIKGVAKYAKVVAQELNADGTIKQSLGTTTTDTSGHYSLSLPSAYGGGPILLTLSDAANSAQPTMLVCDVAAGCGNKSQYVFGADYPIGGLVMTALLGTASGTTVTAQITPLTTVAADSSIAAAKSGQSLTAAFVNAENTGLGQLVGVSDIIGTEPVNLADKTALASATTAQREYAYLAAGIAELAFTTYDGNTDPVTAALGALVKGTGNGQIDVNDGGDPATVSLADLFAAALTQVPTPDTAVTSTLMPLSDAAASASAGTTDAMLADSDGDGVPDYLDKCPNTPSGTTVDANGCPVGTSPVTHTVTATGATGGTISPSSATVNDGATTNFTVTPDSGYVIGTVSGCAGSLNGNTYTTGAVSGDCTVTATFLATTPATYTVTATAGNGGTISPATADVTDGQTTSFIVSPNSGYNIGIVTGCNGALNGSTYTTGAITSDCTVTASFTLTSTHTVTATAGSGGTISPPSATVSDGATTTFTVTPDAGENTATATGCGGTLNGTIYTTGPITADCTVAVTFTAQKIAFGDGSGTISIMNIDGSNVRSLTNVTSAGCMGMEMTSQSWSPDGTQIAFSCKNLSSSNIFSINADDTNLTQVTKYTTFANVAYNPAWSPDGNEIAVEGSDTIDIMNIDGSNVRPLTNVYSANCPNGSNNSLIQSPSWSPDGTKIAFSCKVSVASGATINIFIINADDTNLTQVTYYTTSANYAASPAWSPDGSEIAFEGPDTIYIMNSDGSNIRPLTNVHSANCPTGLDNISRPSWSPDGTQLAFSCTVSLASGSTSNIFIINADDTNLTQITQYTTSANVAYDPVWW